MFNKIGILKSRSQTSEVAFGLNEIKDGLNCKENYIILKKNNKLNIYDRTCDHAGGKIISKNNRHICPMHNWEFDPIKGTYKNGIKKDKLKYIVRDGKIILKDISLIPEISKSKNESKTKIRFFNHAFLQIETKDFKFIYIPPS